MGKLRHARTDATAPQLLRIRNLELLRLVGNQRQQPLLHNLSTGRSQPSKSRKAKYKLGYMWRSYVSQTNVPCTQPRGSMRSNFTAWMSLPCTLSEGTATRM